MEKLDADFPQNRFVVFEKIARESFWFLEDEYGFKLLSVERSGDDHVILRYVSDWVFLSLHYGSPGYELDFSFGRLGIEDQLDKQNFTSGDLLYLEGCEKFSDYSIYSAYSYDNLRKCLPKLAELLKECGAACLRGEGVAFEKMLFEQEKDRNRWLKRQELSQARQLVADAWEKKDYAKVIKIFDPIVNELTMSERRKLMYAHKHFKGIKNYH